MDKIFSTLTYYPSDPDVVDVVTFGYDNDYYGEQDTDITSRVASTYEYVEGNGWSRTEWETSGYTYWEGHLSGVDYEAWQAGDAAPVEEWWEAYAHDIFGRRIGMAHIDPGMDSKEESTMYDYAGLSNQVLVVRDETDYQGELPFGYQVEDPYVSTFTHGPMGVITRTDERFNT